MATYVALVHKEEGSSYGISFPDFLGCISGGDTLEECLADGADALGFHIRGMLKDGLPIPDPTPLDRVLATEDMTDAAAVLITPNMQRKGKAIRLNITLDEFLVEQIDAHAAKVGKNRSAFLADAAREAMA